MNARYILSVLPNLNQRFPNIYLYNGLVLIATFIPTRVLLYGIGLADIYLNLLPHLAAGGIVLRVVPLLLSAGYVLNLYWAAKLVRGAAKHLHAIKND